jgi:hypothetical protein
MSSIVFGYFGASTMVVTIHECWAAVVVWLTVMKLVIFDPYSIQL